MLNARVKVAVRLAPERGRAALHAVDFYVLTSWNVFQSHFCEVPRISAFCDEDFGVSPLPHPIWKHSSYEVGGLQNPHAKRVRYQNPGNKGF
jgi:hypothetical protein